MSSGPMECHAAQGSRVFLFRQGSIAVLLNLCIFDKFLEVQESVLHHLGQG